MRHNNLRSLRRRALVVLLACSLIFGANHLRQPAESSTPTAAATPSGVPYSSHEIVEFLVLNSGRITHEHPGLSIGAPIAGIANDSDRREIVNTVTNCVGQVDKNFQSSVTDNFQSGQPYRVEQAINQFNEDIKEWGVRATSKSSRTLASPCDYQYPDGLPQRDPGSGWYKNNGLILTDYVAVGSVTFGAWGTVAVAAALSLVVLVTGAAVVSVVAIFVPIFITYQFEHRPKQIDFDEAVRKIVLELRPHP
ncbi:hypothetical protein [Mycobacteroides saopaulense]|uniref:hypothetical protein n=1 Tax=Mycobacteroides saopaulense TaxID=1578165 RepID=UPI0012FFA199|nr:hypothetical protein [Mycobacteroides saopaulense]